jgi:hypothetical protein
MMEEKSTDSSLPPALRNFHRRYGIQSSLVIKELKREQEIAGIFLETAENFTCGLFL